MKEGRATLRQRRLRLQQCSGKQRAALAAAARPWVRRLSTLERIAAWAPRALAAYTLFSRLLRRP